MPQEITKPFDAFSSELRSAESFRHEIKIHKPSGFLDHMIEWAKIELRKEWRWALVRGSSKNEDGQYIFYFDSEADYLAFVLKFA